MIFICQEYFNTAKNQKEYLNILVVIYEAKPVKVKESSSQILINDSFMIIFSRV